MCFVDACSGTHLPPPQTCILLPEVVATHPQFFGHAFWCLCDALLCGGCCVRFNEAPTVAAFVALVFTCPSLNNPLEDTGNRRSGLVVDIFRLALTWPCLAVLSVQAVYHHQCNMPRLAYGKYVLCQWAHQQQHSNSFALHVGPSVIVPRTGAASKLVWTIEVLVAGVQRPHVWSSLGLSIVLAQSVCA